MSRPPVARTKILNAFESLLIRNGVAGATLDAVAAEAGVSKGGVLYHFPSKQALVDGALYRLKRLALADLRRMRESRDGPAAYFLRTSVFNDTDFDRAFIAATQLAQAQDSGMRDALEAIDQAWFRVVLDELGDVASARAIINMGDGLYFRAALGAGGVANLRSDAEVADLLAVLARLRASLPARAGHKSGAADD